VTASPGADLWQAYAHVYALMENISFVREQHARHLKALRGLRVVFDAGCGIGSLTVRLAEEPDRTVLCLDNDLAMLSVAKRRLLGGNGGCPVTFARGDVSALPYASGTVDGYLSNNVLYCLDDESAVLGEMTRVTRRGGRASIASPRPSMDVEVLLEVMEAELRELDSPMVLENLGKFATVNRSLQGILKNRHEPCEFAEQLEGSGCWKVLEATKSYLEQDFFVVALRV
jgi:ubiquinone/menaquinone biosynthesis C-methylase UbiE